MSAMASQITDVSIVCSTVGSGTDQRKHESSATLAFVRGIHQWPVNSPHKRPVTRKMFPFDDVIMKKYLFCIWRVFYLCHCCVQYTGLILGLCPANERWRYIVTTSHWLGVNLQSALNIALHWIRRYRNNDNPSLVKIIGKPQHSWRKYHYSHGAIYVSLLTHHFHALNA